MTRHRHSTLRPTCKKPPEAHQSPASGFGDPVGIRLGAAHTKGAASPLSPRAGLVFSQNGPPVSPMLVFFLPLSVEGNRTTS